MDNRPIGIFDSGLGGLTVLKEIMGQLPGESLVYFGDCGRVPYGTKSKETVVKYTFQDIRFLLTHDVKLVVMACNTASACSIEEVKKSFDTEVIEVINPGAAAAVRATRGKKIGIIGTQATVGSGVYEKAIKDIQHDIDTYASACPLLVPLVEEGWWEKKVTYDIVSEYLRPLAERKIDTLVMGCTHYPLLEKTLKAVAGEDVTLVNSAKETALVVKKYINEHNIERDPGLVPEHRFYTSDSEEKFRTLGSLFLGKNIESVEKIDIEKY